MKIDIKYKFNKRILSIALVGVIMVCSSCLMFVYDPLQIMIRKILTLSPGTFFFGVWSVPPYDVVMKIYIFNFTNSEQFLRGEEKMNFKEIGPYSYKEILTNNNATFFDDGTVTYSPRRDFTVDQENSKGNAKLDSITIPNIPLLGIQSYLQDSSLVTNLGFSSLSAALGSQAVINLTVHEFLWGYNDKLVALAHQYIPSWIDFGKFGILERLLSRDNGNKIRISVEPEKRKPSAYDYLLTEEEKMSKFHIVDWNGSPGLSEWGFVQQEPNRSSKGPKKCQLVQGAFDGTVFPLKLRENRTLILFRKAFCRPVPLVFKEKAVTGQGFKCFTYKMGKDMFASPEINPYNECFCFKGQCPAKGLQSIAPCYYDLPVILSQPHFLNADPEVLNSVSGLAPVEEKHASVATLEPNLGIPLDGSTLKIQVNLGVGNTKYNTRTKPFNNITIPLFWIELTCKEMPPHITFLLKLVINVLPIVQNVVSYLLALIGLAMISGAALLTLVFFNRKGPRSFGTALEYSPVPLITIPAQYFKPEFRILK